MSGSFQLTNRRPCVCSTLQSELSHHATFLFRASNANRRRWATIITDKFFLCRVTRSSPTNHCRRVCLSLQKELSHQPFIFSLGKKKRLQLYIIRAVERINYVLRDWTTLAFARLAITVRILDYLFRYKHMAFPTRFCHFGPCFLIARRIIKLFLPCYGPGYVERLMCTVRWNVLRGKLNIFFADAFPDTNK